MDREKAKYAAEVANNYASNFRKCMFAGPLLLVGITIVVGIIEGVWWQAIGFAIVIGIFVFGWNTKALDYGMAAAELEQYANGERDEVSDKTQKIYKLCLATPGALWFGIIMLGVGAIVLIGIGVFIINTSMDRIVDMPGVFVGIFVTVLGGLMAMPAVQWIMLLPKAKKYAAKPSDENSEK